MENSGRRVMYRKVTRRPVSASANVYDCVYSKERFGSVSPDGLLAEPI
jgi:hypothetical protein